MRNLCLSFAAFATIVPAVPAHSAVQSPSAPTAEEAACDIQSTYGGGAVGCAWIGSSNLGPMPQILYWHIDRFADVASAESSRTLYGTVTVALGGRIFLQTVNDNPSWVAEGGERLAMIGPLFVPSNADLTARFMEMTSPLPPTVRTAAGPTAFFSLEGGLCVETPAGAQQVGPRGSAVVPAKIPERPSAPVGTRMLVLAVHASGGNWLAGQSPWAPAGACDQRPRSDADSEGSDRRDELPITE